MNWRIPVSLKVTVPLILLSLAGLLSAVSGLYTVPKAERGAVEDGRKHLVQEMSRLQSMLEYLLLKGDLAAVQQQIAVVAHNHDYSVAALTDDRHSVIAATRRAWLGRPLPDVFPGFDPSQATRAARERRASVTLDRDGNTLIGYAGILMRSASDELRPSRGGGLLLAFDLTRSRSEARALVVQQSLYWAASVTVLALILWLVFHFLLTRRTASLVRAAEELAGGNLSARSGLSGPDELGRLGRAFDAMTQRIASTQCRLQDDIAARERSQEALRVSEESYRAIFEASEDAIFVHDIDTGAIVDANPKACAAFGYSLQELRLVDIGRLGSGQPPYTQVDALALIRRASGGEQLRIEWHSRSRDGRLRWDEVVVKRVMIGGRVRVLAIARDITGKKSAAEELGRQREALYQREKLAALGSLLAGVAHELNNPLSVVVARAVLLEEQGGPSTLAAAQRIRSAAERCARIVRTFLSMARQRQPERGPVAINDVVAAALDIAGYAIRTSSIEVVQTLATDIPLVLADADQLHQLLLNLIINAQQALQDRPAPRRMGVTTCFDADADMLHMTVTDNGSGVPDHLRTRIFEPYFTTKPMGMGTGVGLAVSLGIVEAHGGTITLSCPPGGGAEFAIRLPAGSRAAGGPRAESTLRRVEHRRYSVLVVDDEADVREALAEILAGAGHRVVAAASGREALHRLSHEPFDAILTDLRMPDLDGRALYLEIQRARPEQAARVVFVTGDTLSTNLRELLAESGRPVIEKPFLPAEVRRVVADTARQPVRVAPS